MGDLFWLLIIGIVVYCIVKNSKKKRENIVDMQNPSPSTSYYHREYKRKSLMTDYEQKFYEKLTPLLEEYLIIPQVNLAAIIEKKSNSRFHTELFRNIDFGIFDKDTKNILLLIEINDKTHNYNSRKKRDKSVRSICSEAGIKLITFYTFYPNEAEYVLNRIKKEINEVKNNEKFDNNINLENL